MRDQLFISKYYSFFTIVIIPVSLTLLGIVLIWLHLIFSPYSYTVTISPHSDNMISMSGKPLLSSARISGNFVANENHLGILTIRFYIDRQDVKDTLIFRLKEKGASKWYYEGSYNTEQFYTLPFYPFGFPPINDSKGKEYVFELESQDGSPNNSVYISTVEPNLVSSYQYSKEELLSNYKNLLTYSFHKIRNSVLYMDMGFAIFVYFIPLLFFLVWHFELRKFVSFKKSKVVDNGIQMSIMSKILHIRTVSIFHFVLLIVTFTDVLYIRIYHDLVTVVLFTLWIWTTKTNRLQSSYHYFLACILLGITMITNEYSMSVAGKAAVWLFMFLLLGIGRDIYEIIKFQKVSQ